MSSRSSVADQHTLQSRLVLDAAQRAATYVSASREREVFPTEQALRDLAGFPRELADEPVPPSDVLAMLDELGSPATVASTGGRYFGFVNGGTDPAASAAAVLVAAWDQNVALPVMSPVAALLDELAARWSCQLLGLPDTAIAAFCSGASIANLTCILAARDALLHRAGWSVERRGLTGAPPLRVIASAEIHASVAKALRAAGFGTDDVTPAPTDECGRVLVDEFPSVDDRTLVLLQAGNVNTGHSDPFREIIPLVHDQDGWVHVDGAFGLWATASETQRHLVDGVELADSWATDAHKWLNAPYDSGIAICRVPADLRRAMAFDAAYFATDAERAAAHLGLQMSQRARGAEIWAILASRGRRGIAELVDRLCAHAKRMAGLLDAAGARILVPTALNQVLVQFDDDQTTDAVIAAVQADRTCWAGGTRWHGHRAMRISICDAATTRTDIETAVHAILRCWRACKGA
ncbi:aminotransferase class V-fold PLP-dependent enzyme [Saccharopolyspora sp. K220]|uniref:pyridoxal phosphate-dependent decarboxylase family protein n=1 Tax=Saccharopolyspora soli TaxID=2926618 RepID=UPI001F593D01|nr:aminotransferase class V-fold PLP-dependent enzyme [Saccharopolyspora soli]MCI2419287.1 aminotransferase class V-fold PLP-dependent enzyme [Saccharopolyspora soli]